MKILELIQKTTAFFEKDGVPDPRLDTELILAHVLRLKRMDLYLQFERSLSEAELDLLRPLVRRRASREPLQHILGSVDFFGLELMSTHQALIPRPETEILVQLAIQSTPSSKDFLFLDIGTGTGAIVLAMLKACPHARAVAIDISLEALKLAESNAKKAGLQDRVEFRHGNLFEPIASGEIFDLMISNPPYIPSAELPHLQPEVRYDPPQSLDGGPDGLQIIRKLISNSKNFLKKDGKLLLELGHDQAASVCALLEKECWTHIQIHKDLQSHPRIISAQSGSTSL